MLSKAVRPDERFPGKGYAAFQRRAERATAGFGHRRCLLPGTGGSAASATGLEHGGFAAAECAPSLLPFTANLGLQIDTFLLMHVVGNPLVLFVRPIYLFIFNSK